MVKKKIKFTAKFADKLSTLIMASFGFVAALAWNEAMQAAFKKFFANSNTIIAQFSYALLITFVAVAIIYWLSDWRK